MSFMNGKRQEATEKDLNAPWSGNRKNFRCGLCGYKFKLGDGWRFLYTNDMKGYAGNPLVCDECFTTKEDTREKWKKLNDEFKNIFNNPKYWKLARYYAEK